MLKANPVFSPLNVFGSNILGYKDDPRGPADEFSQVGFRFGCNQGQYRRAIGRSNSQPALPGLHADVEGQIESELIQVETQASLLVANKDIHRMHTEVRALFSALVCYSGGKRTGHGDDYKTLR
jgi:hypothetical protein